MLSNVSLTAKKRETIAETCEKYLADRPLIVTLYQDRHRIESARLRGWDYRSRGWYFVTICASNHASIFGDIVNGEMSLSPIGRIAESDLQTLRQHYDNVHIDESIVMPNHIHAIIMIDGEHCFPPSVKMTPPLKNASAFVSPPAGSLSTIVRSYKAGVTLKCRELGLTRAIWQPRFYDHLLRGDKVISAVREYIRNNPENWGVDKENPFRPPSS